jgi:prohibitin 2
MGGKIITGAIVIFVLVLAASSATYVVEPGHRGIEVTLGKVAPIPKGEGFGFKAPFITTVFQQTIRQQAGKIDAQCYSSDLQQIKISLRVLYRQPEAKVVTLYRDYRGDPFQALVEPRIAEAIKELTALRTAEAIVQKREDIKLGTLDSARQKLKDLLIIDDLVIEDISLTHQLEKAIEAKMVQEQEAARARFAQQQAEVEANTAVIKAKGEAESINLRGKAMMENPSVLELQVVEKWDGVTPLVVGPHAEGANMLLPLNEVKREVKQ